MLVRSDDTDQANAVIQPNVVVHPKEDQSNPSLNLKQGWLNQFNPQATLEDVFFCFRMFLGRTPNSEEWAGHTARVGEPLQNVILTYVNSQEFADRNLIQRHTPANIQSKQYDNFIIYAAEDDMAVGKAVLAGQYEADVTAVFQSVLKPGMTVLDIGANIGYFSMLSAAIVGSAGKVISVEPNPDNVKFIEASRKANGFSHVQVIQAAASSDNGILVLRTEYSNGTCGFLPDDIADVFEAETVAALRLDELVKDKVDLIKVDVEGAELLALLGCVNILDRCKPHVVFEFSPNRIIDCDGNVAWQQLLSLLIDRGYTLSHILPSGDVKLCESQELIYQAFEQSGIDHIDILAKKE